MAVVTGAGGGLGRALALELAVRGQRVVALLDEKGVELSDLVGRAVPNVSDWQNLNLNAISKHVRKAIEAADEAGDEDSADLFTEVSRTAEKDAWFIGSNSAKAA